MADRQLENEDELASADEEEIPIDYPSTKLSSITKMRNKILKHMKVKNPGNKEKVQNYLPELQVKIRMFSEACQEQLSRTDVSTDLKLQLNNWYENHVKINQEFEYKVAKWVRDSEDDYLNLNSNFQSEEPKANNDNLLLKSSDTFSAISADSLAQILKQQNEITKLLVQNQVRSMLPQAEPETFDGSDPIDYRSFILSFERTVAQRTSNYADLYYCLVKYTKGEANRIVKSCNNTNIYEAYTNAIRLLEKKYGNQYMLAEHYLSKLEKWPVITKEDSKSLRELSTFLDECLSMMGSLSSMNQLNSPKEIRDILKKLPYEYQRKFREIATTKMENEERILFKDLTKFVARQVRILETPIFGELRKDTSNSNKKKSLNTKLESPNGKKQQCPCCKGRNHELDKCFFFLKKTYEDRRDFIKERKLCFGCLKTSEHNSKNCKNRIICKHCKGNHPSSLHKDKNSEDQTTSSPGTTTPPSNSSEQASTPQTDKKQEKKQVETSSDLTPKAGTSCQARSHSTSAIKNPAILVDVRFTGSNKTIRTYLGLDTYCDSMFIDADLVREAGIEAKQISFSLTTLQSTDKQSHFGLVRGIEILSIDRSARTIVEEGFVPQSWPFTLDDSPKASDVQNYEKLRQLPMTYGNVKIGILIGTHRPDILRPLQTVSTTKRGPYATRHLFGWAINGPINGVARSGSRCFHARTKLENHRHLEAEFESVFSRDFADVDEETMDSIEDRRWLGIAKTSIVKLPNKHLQMNLPFKKDDVIMPDNLDQAYSRIMKQKTRFERDLNLFNDYCKFMNDMLQNDYAERIPDEEINSTPPGKKWYLIHFSVVHKTKKKLRIVFDCSLKFNDVSLNDVLLQGPDNTNSLVGVLLRFREGKFAFSADVRSMFYQVKVPKDDQEFLRFLWFPQNDLSKPPVHFRLKVHVFGAKSSPSCASYALRHSATLGAISYPQEVLQTVRDHFYVDDVLKSNEDLNETIRLAKDLIKLLEENGFDLTSFISNSRTLLMSLPPEKLSKDLKELNLSIDGLPDEKTLGMVWHPETDNFGCRLNINEQPYTKRGVLRTLFSVFDPLFLVSPAIINGKRIFQETCSLKLDWDEELPHDVARRWKQWTTELPLLSKFKVPRCFVSHDFVRIELHFFSDGSYVAYGSVAYLRFVRKDGTAHTSIVTACARMTPIGRSSLKSISLKTPPRIELNSAKLSVVLKQRILKELNLKIDKIAFWSDSVTSLKYILSESGRFQTFVANRVDYIRSNSSPTDWNHVPGILNPADMLSRGISVPKFLRSQLWLSGPAFLRDPNEEWPQQNFSIEIPQDDGEVVRKSLFTSSKSDAVELLLNSTETWTKVKYKVAILLKFVSYLKNKKQTVSCVDVSDLQVAENSIWHYVQQRDFADIITKLKKKKPLTKDRLSRLNPFIDKDGLMRVGGRLKNSNLSESSKHPLILPRSCAIVDSLFRHLHSRTGHLGKESLIAQVRKKYYVIGLSSLSYKITKNCLICRKILAQPSEQRMADLPTDRLQPDLPPFTNTGTDCFGPILVTRGRGRTKEKRYGILFTCVASRAIHIEVLDTLDTDSFINSLIRFTSIRGSVRRIRCDNGTNFVSGRKEIALGVKQWNKAHIDSWCKSHDIDWRFNVPLSPHWGGLWEREVRTCKKTLSSMLSELENKKTLNDESLRTLLCEVMNIMNNRPITQVTCDIDDKEPLTPNHLLRPTTEKYFPPGIFSPCDLYSKRRWRQVQYLVDEFWTRWQKEYVPLLMSRQKWTLDRRSHKVGDLVLVVDQLLPRNMWCLGRIVSVRHDSEGRVRSATVVVSKYRDGSNFRIGTHRYERPITKLILLKTFDELEKNND